jgi:hypothetical protein
MESANLLSGEAERIVLKLQKKFPAICSIDAD